MTLPIVIGCASCEPLAFHESLRPSNDHHYGVPWVSDCRVFKGDEDITMTTTEVVTGPGGWAICLVKPYAVCPCGGEKMRLQREYGDDFRVEISEEGQAIVTAMVLEHTSRDCYRCKLDMLLYGETFIDLEKRQHLDARSIMRIRSEPDPETVVAFRQMVGLGAEPAQIIINAETNASASAIAREISGGRDDGLQPKESD